MSRRIVIDSLAFVREAGLLQGELPIAELTRTLDLLTDYSGLLSYRVEGRKGPRNRLQLFLQIEGVLSLCCQRCLEGIKYPIKVESLLEFVDDEEELTQEEMEDDSKDFLPFQAEIDIVSLIEDEVILGLPQVPRHESCVLPKAGQGVEKSSPFAVLKGFKGKT